MPPGSFGEAPRRGPDHAHQPRHQQRRQQPRERESGSRKWRCPAAGGVASPLGLQRRGLTDPGWLPHRKQLPGPRVRPAWLGRGDHAR